MAAIHRKRKDAPKKSQKTAEKPKKVARAAPVRKPAPTKKPPRKPTRAKRPGNPFTPTPDQRNLVMLAVATGMSEKQIRSFIKNPENGEPISQNTLRKYFAEELANGENIVTARVAGNLVSIATDRAHKGCVTAAIFYLKTRARWREPEPEWYERKRLGNDGDDYRVEQVIECELILEEPRAPALLAPPVTP